MMRVDAFDQRLDAHRLMRLVTVAETSPDTEDRRDAQGHARALGFKLLYGLLADTVPGKPNDRSAALLKWFKAESESYAGWRP